MKPLWAAVQNLKSGKLSVLKCQDMWKMKSDDKACEKFEPQNVKDFDENTHYGVIHEDRMVLFRIRSISDSKEDITKRVEGGGRNRIRTVKRLSTSSPTVKLSTLMKQKEVAESMKKSEVKNLKKLAHKEIESDVLATFKRKGQVPSNKLDKGKKEFDKEKEKRNIESDASNASKTGEEGKKESKNGSQIMAKEMQKRHKEKEERKTGTGDSASRASEKEAEKARKGSNTVSQEMENDKKKGDKGWKDRKTDTRDESHEEIGGGDFGLDEEFGVEVSKNGQKEKLPPCTGNCDMVAFLKEQVRNLTEALKQHPKDNKDSKSLGVPTSVPVEEGKIHIGGNDFVSKEDVDAVECATFERRERVSRLLQAFFPKDYKLRTLDPAGMKDQNREWLPISKANIHCMTKILNNMVERDGDDKKFTEKDVRGYLSKVCKYNRDCLDFEALPEKEKKRIMEEKKAKAKAQREKKGKTSKDKKEQKGKGKHKKRFTSSDEDDSAESEINEGNKKQEKNRKSLDEDDSADSEINEGNKKQEKNRKSLDKDDSADSEINEGNKKQEKNRKSLDEDDSADSEINEGNKKQEKNRKSLDEDDSADSEINGGNKKQEKRKSSDEDSDSEDDQRKRRKLDSESSS